jgi:hypothetical protein
MDYYGGLPSDGETHLAKGFRTVYKKKKGGLRFSDLLDQVSRIDPEMRIRFTSPHPKDFPDEVPYDILKAGFFPIQGKGKDACCM